jgi:ketosteroid isomerase-like protein
MNRILIVAVLIVAPGALAVGQTKTAKSNQTGQVVEQIRKLDQERIQAQIHADAVALDRIYADDFIGIGPSGTVRTKPQVLADFTSHELTFQSITTDEVLIRVYGNTAVETGRTTTVGQDKGKVVPRDNRFTRVWVRRQGRWRLVANHYSTLVVQPARE